MFRIASGTLLGCLFIATGIAAEPVDVEGIVARNLDAVVLIYGTRTDNGAPVQGSGCVVHPDGFVLATAHQAQDVENFSAKFSDGRQASLHLLDVRPKVEFALFKLEEATTRFVAPGDASLLRGGAPLVSIASPVNLEFTTVSGTVANPNKTYDGYEVLLASLTATHGSSGGPVFDRQGRLIGLISGGLHEVDFTIVNKINNAYPLLRDHGILGAEPLRAPEDDVLIPAAGITESELRAIEAYNRGVQSAGIPQKIEAYGLATTLVPGFYEACFNLAVAEARGGAPDRALAAYRRAEALRPNAIEVKRNIGRLYLAGKSYAEAVAVFKDAVALAPAEAQSHNDLGEAYRRAGDLKSAIEAFKASLEIDNKAPRAHFNLALAYAGIGQAQDAVRHFQTYLTLVPDASDRTQVTAMIEKLQAS